jgi:hypothetical protein
MLVEEFTYLLYFSWTFLSMPVWSLAGQTNTGGEKMAIIKQDIQDGFASKKVTSGDPQVVPNHTSAQESNIQTRPLRPK